VTTRGAATRQGKRQGDLLTGKYLLEELLGVGGMGEVYRATNVSLGRKVAIKLLSAEFVKNDDDVNRFLREARAAAAVRHSNVVDVLDVSRDEDGTPFIVQELLAGEDLESYLRSRHGRVGPDEAMELMIPVSDAVSAAHAQNVVHRDLKPANIFLSRDRNKIVPKVLDFGAALFPTIADRSAKEARMLIGTPHYMAPEQIVDKSAVDARSDVWALGVILYEMLVGETPFEAETASAVLNKVKTVNVPLLRTRVKEAPVELEQIIAKCTSRDRAARYADASGVRDALEAVRKKRKGSPQDASAATVDEVSAPLARPKTPVNATTPKVPSIDLAGLPRGESVPQRNLLTLSSPDEDVAAPKYDHPDSLDLDIPAPVSAAPISGTPISSGSRRIEENPGSLDLAPFTPEEEPLGEHPSSLPPVLFSAPSLPAKPLSLSVPRPAAVPADLRDEPSGITTLPLEKARPLGPTAVQPSDYAKRVVAQTWSKADTIRLGAQVAAPALILFLMAGLIPPISQPVRHAMLGDSSLASGIATVVALIITAVLFVRAALRERTRLAWLAAIAALFFGIAMIITTFGASETVESGDLATTSLATLIGPLFPFILSLDWLTKARDFFLDPYSKPEARRCMAISALFLFVTLALSPVGAVRAPARPMNAIQAMLK
jgi:serine/threonine-protein kinase